MKKGPSESVDLGIGFWFRATIAALLLARCSPSPTPHVQWGTEDNPGSSSCDLECLHLSDKQGAQDRLDVGLPRDLHGRLLACQRAFDGETGRPIAADAVTPSGEGWCAVPVPAGKCDPSARPVHFVPAPTPPDGGTPSRTTGFAICSQRDEDCESAIHGGGTPAGCEEDIGLFPGDQAGANCRERCQ